MRAIDDIAADRYVISVARKTISRLEKPGVSRPELELRRLELEFAGALGTSNTIAVGDGVQALKLALLAVGVHKGDEVILPAFTRQATWRAVIEIGAKPVPVEPGLHSYTLDARSLPEIISKHSRAIIVTDLFGMPADILPILELAEQANIPVVEDVGSGFGATYRKRMAGSLGAISCFHFPGLPAINHLDRAGMVGINQEDLYPKVRWHQHKLQQAGQWAPLSPYNAAILTSLLDTHLRRVDFRRGLAKAYQDRLRPFATHVSLPEVTADADPAWNSFVVRCNDCQVLGQYMRIHNVPVANPVTDPDCSTRLAYPPAADGYSASEVLAECSLALPIPYNLDEVSQLKVIHAVYEFVAADGAVLEQTYQHE